MPYFNESQLEQSIIALLQEQGYEHVKGEDIVRNLDEVVLRDDLAEYLRNRYKNDGITDRTDLDDQLSRLLLNAKQFVGDSVIEQVGSREDLKDRQRSRIVCSLNCIHMMRKA